MNVETLDDAVDLLQIIFEDNNITLSTVSLNSMAGDLSVHTTKEEGKEKK